MDRCCTEFCGRLSRSAVWFCLSRERRYRYCLELRQGLHSTMIKAFQLNR